MIKALLNLRLTMTLAVVFACFGMFNEVSAQCGNDAGTMPGAFSPACSGAFVNTTTTGEIIQPGYTLTYVLHDGSAAAIGTVYGVNADGVFVNDGTYPTDIDLAISAVISTVDANGNPNLNDPCLAISGNIQPVRFYDPIVINSTSSCNEVTGVNSITFNITGGAPDFPDNNNFVYVVEGDYEPFCGSSPCIISTPGQTFTFSLTNQPDYQITVVDDGKGCGASFTGPGCIQCMNDAGTPNAPQFICDGATANGQTNNPTVDPGSSIVYALHTGSTSVGTILATNNTGVFANNGTYPTNTQLYITALVGELGANGLPDVNDPCTDVQLPGTPVTFYDAINVTVGTTCDDVSGITTVTYVVSGGTGSYTVSGSDSGTATAGASNVFTLPEGSGTITLNISDSAGCTGGVNQPYSCDGCDNFAGSPNAPQQVCAGQTATGTVSNAVVDPGSSLVYALHSGSTSVGTIYATNTTGTFVNDGSYPTNVQLYVSSLVGELGANGLPDVNDPCTDVQLPGTPVTFLDPISVTISTSCNDVSGVTTVTYVVAGGTGSYNVSGSDTGTAVAGATNTFSLPEGSGTISINVTDGAGCTGSDAVNYFCDGCFNDPGTPSAAQTVCFGDTGVGTVNDAVVDEGILVYALHTGSTSVGTIVDVNTTGVFINNGSYPTNTQLYVSTLVGPDGGNGVPDVNDPCTVVMLPGTPVTFLTDVVVSINTSCDIVSGITTVNYTVSGGTGTYTVSGSDSGTTSAGATNTFTIAEGSGNIIINVVDGAGCMGDATLPYSCDGCDNDAGTQAPPVEACTGETVNGSATGAVVDPGSSIVYVLHDGSNGVGTIYEINSTGSFTNNGSYPINTPLFIATIVGEVGANGLPDLNDPCTDANIPGTLVQFYGPVVITDNFVCDEVSGDLTVTFTVSGGAPSFPGSTDQYTIAGSYTGTVGANTPVSFVIPEGSTSYTINVTNDGAGCSAMTTQPYQCEGCDNNAGTPNAPLTVCFGDSANGQTNNPTVDPGSSIVYALHTGSTSVGTILATNSTGVFLNNGSYPTNTQLYITALVGELGANGLPDLNDPCTDVQLPGTPVTFLTDVAITVNTVCNDVSGITTVTYVVSGGTGTYTISGSDSGTATAGAANTFTLAEGAGTITINAIDGAGCDASATTNYSCDGCDNDAGTQPAGPLFVCSGDNANAITTGENVDEGVLVYVLHSGSNTVGTIYDVNGSGVFVNNGSYPVNTQLYVSAIVGDLGANGVPDVNDPCTDANLPGTPVTFLTPIVINESISCDEISGVSTVTFTVGGGMPMATGSSYTISGSYNGTASAGQTVTFTVAEGSGTLTLNVSDNAGCDASQAIPYNCQGCNNEAGTMPQFPQVVCFGDQASAQTAGASAGPGASLVYALHTGQNSVGNIIDVNTTGVFTNNGSYPYGTQLYISAVVAELIGGAPNLNDPCLDVALPGTPVTFNAPLSVNGSGDCDMISGQYTVTVQVSGGAGGTYTVTGDFNGTISNGTLTFVDNGDGIVNLNITDANGCSAPYSEAYQCMGCLGNEAGVLPQNLTLACAGDQVAITTAGASILSGSVLVYVLHDGDINNPADVNTSGVFTNNGSYPTNTPMFVCAVVGEPGPNGIPNLSDPCTAVTDNCAPVGFLDPIVIDHDYICDNSVGEFTVSFNISGGGPSFPGTNHVYTVTGNYNGTVTAGPTQTFGPLGDGDVYSINVINDGKGCAASIISDPIQCEKLPIELVSFTGEVQGNGNLLKWVTATEINNDYFTLERSADGIDFEKITNVDGAGFSQQDLYYDYFDADAPAGISYYRLSQTDFDGTFEIVGVIQLTRGEVTMEITDLMPNPVNNLLTVNFLSDTNTEVVIKITDVVGRVLDQRVIDVNHNENQTEFNVADFVPGIYMITIEGESTMITDKFIKK